VEAQALLKRADQAEAKLAEVERERDGYRRAWRTMRSMFHLPEDSPNGGLDLTGRLDELQQAESALHAAQAELEASRQDAIRGWSALEVEADRRREAEERLEQSRSTVTRFQDGTLLGKHGREQADRIHALETALERVQEIRNGSPNAFYAAFDKLVKDIAPADPERTEEPPMSDARKTYNVDGKPVDWVHMIEMAEALGLESPDGLVTTNMAAVVLRANGHIVTDCEPAARPEDKET
jgi:hypothetical protein